MRDGRLVNHSIRLGDALPSDSARRARLVMRSSKLEMRTSLAARPASRAVRRRARTAEVTSSLSETFLSGDRRENVGSFFWRRPL